jgi:hypothetical protein
MLNEVLYCFVINLLHSKHVFVYRSIFIVFIADAQNYENERLLVFKDDKTI